jgi:hypothetical protein
MSDKQTCEDTTVPLWRRLRRLIRSDTVHVDPFAGPDTAGMDLGYEAAYAPGPALAQGCGSETLATEDRGAG